MGEEDRRELRVATDPVAALAAYRATARRMQPAPLLWVYAVIGSLLVVFAGVHLAHHWPFAQMWPQLLAGLIMLLSAAILTRPRPAAFPAEAIFSDAGIAFRFAAESPPAIVPWKRVRSVENSADAFVVTIAVYGILSRLVCVAKPSDPATVTAILDRCYAHLVGTDGLAPTPLERLGIIANTTA